MGNWPRLLGKNIAYMDATQNQQCVLRTSALEGYRIEKKMTNGKFVPIARCSRCHLSRGISKELAQYVELFCLRNLLKSQISGVSIIELFNRDVDRLTFKHVGENDTHNESDTDIDDNILL